MEPNFAPKTLQYLSCLLWENQSLEKTADIIVPDTSPDVLRILSVSALAVVRSKECRGDGAAVTGGVRANVMYLAEGETAPRNLETYLPFEVHKEAAGLTENAGLQATCSVKNADARPVNSRKITVRVNLCCSLRGYEKQEKTICELESCPPHLQIHETQFPLVLPTDAAERSFQITEQLRFPAARPLVGDVFQFLPRISVTEKRLAGNKAVFKGTVLLHVLYATTDGTPVTYETEIPFSQYCELAEVCEEEELSLLVCLTGCQTDRTVDGEGEGLFLTLHLLAQCLVTGKKDVTFLDDAYALGYGFAPEWTDYEFSPRLDAVTFDHPLRESLSVKAADVVSCRLCCEQPVVTRKDNCAELTVPVTAQLLYLDRDGSLQSATHRWEEKETLKLAENVQCRADARLTGDVNVLAAGDTVELRCPMEIRAETVANCTYRSLCGCVLTPEAEKTHHRPGVIVRRTGQGERLWDIAKANTTTVERIRRANRLSQDVTEAGILLIPT